MGLDQAAREFGGRLFANDARPGGVLEHPGHLSDTAMGNLASNILLYYIGIMQAAVRGMAWVPREVPSLPLSP